MELISSPTILALNHLINGESWAQSRLMAHSGAQVLIDAGVFELRFGIDQRGFFQSSEKGLEPDVSITLPSNWPVHLLFDHGTLFSSVKLGGAADIAESIAFVLRNLQWDAEGDLARLLGDIPARRLARMAKTIAAGIDDAFSRLSGNFSEYSVEELGVLTAKRDIAEFGSALNSLRDDVARLEKRISRL